MTLETLRRSAIIIMGLVGVGAFGAACSKSDSTPTIASFCAQKAEKECGTKDKGVALDCGTTVAACTNARSVACITVATQQSGLHPLRADAIDNCLSKTATAYAAATITPDLRAAADDACARVFSGMNKGAATDPPCASDVDCDTGLICDRTVCAMPVSVAANARCNNPGETCPATQYCAGTYPQQVCTDKAAAGAACTAGPCLDTLRCMNGFCADKVGTRGACTTNADCASTAPYCDPYNGNECFLGFTPASPGGTNECVAFGGPLPGAGGSSGSTGGAGGMSGAGGQSAAGGAGGNPGIGGSLGLL